MAPTRKQLDRLSFWKWVALLAVAYTVAIFLGRKFPLEFGASHIVFVVWLAVILARRFRDIGWPAWIGPTILLSALIGLGAVAGIYNVMYPDAGRQFVQLVEVLRMIGGSALLPLLFVAGCVPGKLPENDEIAGVFD